MKRASFDDTYKAYELWNKNETGDDAWIDLGYFENRHQARARGAWDAGISYIDVRAKRAPHHDKPVTPGSYLENGCIRLPKEAN